MKNKVKPLFPNMLHAYLHKNQKNIQVIYQPPACQLYVLHNEQN